MPTLERLAFLGASSSARCTSAPRLLRSSGLPRAAINAADAKADNPLQAARQPLAVLTKPHTPSAASPMSGQNSNPFREAYL